MEEHVVPRTWQMSDTSDVSFIWEMRPLQIWGGSEVTGGVASRGLGELGPAFPLCALPLNPDRCVT